MPGQERVSEKLVELPRREAGIVDDAARGECIHRVMPWSIALPGNAKPSLFERPEGPKVRDTACRLELDDFAISRRRSPANLLHWKSL